MILTRDDYLARIQGRIGEDTSDEAMTFIEDMTDTFDDMSNKLTDTTDWKAKYEENDNAWRTKYKERFFSGDETTSGEAKVEQNDDVADDGTDVSFDDLFEEREG